MNFMDLIILIDKEFNWFNDYLIKFDWFLSCHKNNFIHTPHYYFNLLYYLLKQFNKYVILLESKLFISHSH